MTAGLGGRRFILHCGMILVALLAGCSRAPVVPAPVETPVTVPAPADGARGGESYTGLLVEPAAEGGARVRAVEAGPAAQAGLLVGDRILALNGAVLTAPMLRERLAGAVPGEALRLEVDRNGGTFELALVPGLRADWQGPAAWPARVAAAPAAHAPFAWASAPGNTQAPAARAAIQKEEAALQTHAEALAADPAGYNKTVLVRAALRNPHALLAAARTGTDANAAPAPSLAARVLPTLCADLALPCPDARTPAPVTTNTAAPLDALLADVERAFAAVPGGRAALDEPLRYLLGIAAAGQLLHAQPEALKAIAVLRASMQLDKAALLTAFARLLELAEASPVALASVTVEEAPEALRALVEGSLLAWATTSAGYMVLGDSGDNRYDMDGLVAVFDAGGNDAYRWGEAVPPPVQVIVDDAGTDTYESAWGGAGTGWLGVSVVIDAAGNDTYRSVFGGCGAGLFGYGLLLDRAGSDAYRCDAWSQGAGLYGAGLLLDDGREGDIYIAQILSQGAGGPGGSGLLADAGGDDLYRANGFVASAYGTPAVYMGLSQGVGYGFRPHDHGGIGRLVDRNGNDRYEGGEFSQGGGYYWGTGILVDTSGDDLYLGHRYAQGFAAHQAVGLLVDAAGDDVYWSMTAAGQAAAWDESLAMLFDANGDDHYRGGTLSQGAAAHQSRALLCDGAGDDVYHAADNAAQGAAGDNHYHWEARVPVGSLALLFDGAGSDRYSSGLTPGSVRTALPAARDGKGLAALAIDHTAISVRPLAEPWTCALSPSP